jgi:hypothetical protein
LEAGGQGLSYNALVQRWPEIMRLAADAGSNSTTAAVPATSSTGALFDDEDAA